MEQTPGWGEAGSREALGGHLGSSPMPILVFTSGLGASPGCPKAWMIMKTRIQLMTSGMESADADFQRSQKAREV